MKRHLIRNAAYAFFSSVLFLSFPAGAFAATDDNVLSANIKEADGTSGQNTNAGSGVKTGHIQDAAVTASKLASGSVATDKIADGGVSDAKISGPISTSKLNVGTTAGTVAAGDHSHDGIYQRKYANVKIVSLDGNGDFTDPMAAMASITDASAANPYLLKIMPGVYDLGSGTLQMKEYVDIEGSGESVTVITSAANTAPFGTVNGANDAELRQLTVVNTGTGYSPAGIITKDDIDDQSVTTKLTNITVKAGGGPYQSIGIYNSYLKNNVPNETVMRNVTVLVSGGYDLTGILTSAYGSVTMMNVQVTVTGGTNTNYGIQTESDGVVMNNVVASASGSRNYGVANYSGTCSMSNVTATASGGTQNRGIYNTNCTVVMSDVTSTAKDGSSLNYGLYNVLATSTIDRSTFEATGNGGLAIYSFSSGEVRIGASKLVGGVGGIISTCVASYDGNYAPLSATCQ